jgi:hypothetical protein
MVSVKRKKIGKFSGDSNQNLQSVSEVNSVSSSPIVALVVKMPPSVNFTNIL